MAGQGPRLPASSPHERRRWLAFKGGKTNKEIAAQLYLSIDTVETHLAHAYQKLGINWTVSRQARFELLDRLPEDNLRRTPFGQNQ